MPTFKRADAELYYEVHGQGFPILLYAPGGLRSQLNYWKASPADPKQPAAWMNPMVALSDKFTVIGMDQRNAGRSVADVRPEHGWHTFAEDHFALMGHLGFDRFHVMGGCIGGSYCFEAIEHDPARIAAAIGPCIRQASYEVGPEFAAQFSEASPAFARYFTPGPGGKQHFDLPGFCADRLKDAGVARIEALPLDTYALPEALFSHRRSVHRTEGDYGRNCAAIALKRRT